MTAPLGLAVSRPSGSTRMSSPPRTSHVISLPLLSEIQSSGSDNEVPAAHLPRCQAWGDCLSVQPGGPLAKARAHALASPLPASSSLSGCCPAQGFVLTILPGKPLPDSRGPLFPSAARGPSAPYSIAAQHARLLCSWNRLRLHVVRTKGHPPPCPPPGRSREYWPMEKQKVTQC